MKAQPKEPQADVGSVNIVVGYKKLASLDPLISEFTRLYRLNRKKAQECFEKSDSSAAYWSGRADTLEILLDNCREAKSKDLRELT